MAETIARRGGIAVIPQDIPLQIVHDVISWVKTRHAFFDTPITLAPHQTIADAISLLHKRAHGAIVVVENNKPVGIITEEDCEAVDRFTQLHQVMSKTPSTISDSLDPRQAFDFLHENRRTVAPVVTPSGELAGILTRVGALRATLYEPALDANGRLRIAAAVGINGDIADKAARLIASGADVLVVDTAHGHQTQTLRAIEAALRLRLNVTQKSLPRSAAAQQRSQCLFVIARQTSRSTSAWPRQLRATSPRVCQPEFRSSSA